MGINVVQRVKVANLCLYNPKQIKYITSMLVACRHIITSLLTFLWFI